MPNESLAAFLADVAMPPGIILLELLIEYWYVALLILFVLPAVVFVCVRTAVKRKRCAAPDRQ